MLKTSTDRLLGLLPLAMALHNLEEYAGMETYAQRRGLHLEHGQVQVALGLATVLPGAAALLAAAAPRGSARKFAGFVMAGGLLANSASHLGQTLLFRDRSPGTLTALGLYAPLLLALARSCVREGYLTPGERHRAFALGAALMVPLTLLMQGAGWAVRRLRASGPLTPGRRQPAQPFLS